MKPLAQRAQTIRPFHVMDILARARARETAGASIIHLEIGEPDFATPAGIVAAGINALQQGHTHYTSACGLPALRAAIAAHYAPLAIDPERVIVTPGSSGALQLAAAALIDPGDEVLLADPSYPCNRQFVLAFGGVPKLIPVGADSAYQLNAQLIREHWGPRTRVVIVASPSNPTGSLLAPTQLAEIISEVTRRDGAVIIDEIYHGLVYDGAAATAASYSDQVFVVNSFSKYYGMTGWRVGWLLAPLSAVPALDRLAQNFFLAASTPAQYAALAAFTPTVQRELERRREVFRARRDYLVPTLRELGFTIPIMPAGAFYIYAGCEALHTDAAALARELLDHTGVAITPGLDFGEHRAAQHVRFAYANDLAKLQEAVQRMRDYFAA